jgi:hypothetical protein
MSFVPPSHVDAITTLVILFGLLGVGWGAITGGMLWRALAFARLQRHDDELLEKRSTWPLSAGPSRVVHGTVEIDGEDVAVEIDIVEKVTNYTNKGARSHVWRETSRDVTTRPFRLVRDDGRSVLVEPDAGVLVVDELERSYPDDRPMERIRSAVVRAGDEVYVCGDLTEATSGGAYRGNSTWVMGPPRKGRLLVATEMMRNRYRNRIRTLGGFGAVSLLLFCFFHGLYTRPVVALLCGSRDVATIAVTQEWTTRSKSSLVYHYEVTATTRDGLVLTSEVPYATYAWARDTRVANKPAVVTITRAGDSTILGDEVTISIGLAIFGPALVLLITLIALVQYSQQAPWYDRRNLFEPGNSPEHWGETRKADGTGESIDPDAD